MADEQAPRGGEGEGGRGRGGFGRGRGGGRGGRGGRGGGRGGAGGGRDENVWVPVTKLGRLVKDGKIGSIEEIFLFSLPVKEAEIIDFFLKDKLLDEVMKIMPVQVRCWLTGGAIANDFATRDLF
jgi:small subunit ribosomal protein S2e